MTTETPRKTIQAAYRNFRKVTNSAWNQNTFRVFCQFVNHTAWEGAWYDVKEETRYKLEWLTGPNHVFMFKVWMAKYGDDTRSGKSTKSVEAVGKGDGEG